MNWRDLWRQSERHLQLYPIYLSETPDLSVFSKGAAWMTARLNEMDNHKTTRFDPSIPFNAYGWFKYGLCISACIISAFLLFPLHFLLVPLSIVVFYFLEVQLLFLFPLLIDQVKQPILTSIKITYHLGVFKCMGTVMPIAFWMLWGIFSKNQPFRNWHVGALAILIWYKDEVRLVL